MNEEVMCPKSQRQGHSQPGVQELLPGPLLGQLCGTVLINGTQRASGRDLWAEVDQVGSGLFTAGGKAEGREEAGG